MIFFFFNYELIRVITQNVLLRIHTYTFQFIQYYI